MVTKTGNSANGLLKAGYSALVVSKPLYIYHVVPDSQTSSLSSSVHTKKLYAELWRQIRSRHPESYRLFNMLRTWRTTRDGSGRVPLWKGLAGYTLALTLPDGVFNRLFSRFKRRRMTAETAVLPIGSEVAASMLCEKQ